MDSNEAANSEVMASTADVAKLLNVGGAMVRKWAIAYEQITGDRVRLRSKRDGREFSASQVDVIARAKRYVDREGVKVETALKMALGQTELVPAALDPSAEDSGSLEVFKEFLARNDETSQLLLQEIRGLREDLRQSQARELSQPRAEKENSAQVTQPAKGETQHGLLVRLAMRLESLLPR
jgi:hypothetical protein